MQVALSASGYRLSAFGYRPAESRRPSLGDWIGRDELPNDKNAPSDGYATGLVIYILRQAGMPAKGEPIQKGVVWLKSNQRESGRWFTRSVNTDRYHFITHAGTAYAVLALKVCE